MKISSFLMMMVLWGAVVAPSPAATLTDVNPGDGNTVDAQHSNGQLFADISLREPWLAFDSVFRLEPGDLLRDQGWGSFWLNVGNRSGYSWGGYRIQFFDATFTRPFEVPLHAFSEGPAEFFPRWSFQPNFRANTIELTGGTGVLPGQGFYLAALFDLSSVIPAGSTEFTFGIRQVPTGANIPDQGGTLVLLAIGWLFVVGSARFVVGNAGMQ